MAKAKKASKRAAPVKAERTRSRTPKPAERRMLQFEKLGKLITWHVPPAPYVNNANLRSAFVGGFECRVSHVQSSSDEGVPTRFDKDTASQRAFEDGYNDAANQDGQNLRPAALQGSVTKKAKATK